MKGFFLGLILVTSLSASAQNTDCKTWLGESSDSIGVIQKAVEQFLTTELAVSGNPEVKTIYEMKDKLELSSMKVWLKPKKALVNGAMGNVYSISSIKVVGLADKIDLMFKSLKDKVVKCTTESTDMNLAFGTTKIYIEKTGGDHTKKNIPLSTLTITSK